MMLFAQTGRLLTSAPITHQHGLLQRSTLIVCNAYRWSSGPVEGLLVADDARVQGAVPKVG